MGFHLHSFTGGSPAVPEPFVKGTVLFPPNRLWHPCQQSVGRGRVHLEPQFSSCVFTLTLGPQCFDFDSIGLNFEIGKHEPPVNSFVLLEGCCDSPETLPCESEEQLFHFCKKMLLEF